MALGTFPNQYPILFSNVLAYDTDSKYVFLTLGAML